MSTTICPINKKIIQKDFAFYYAEDENGYVVYGMDENLSLVNIPSQIEGIDVVAIGKQAFQNFRIGELVMPDTITTIGEKAFSGCGKLKTVNIPKNVTIIGAEAFFNCFNIVSVTLSENIKEIGNKAFKQCKIESLNIPCSICSIEEQALPYTVKSIEYGGTMKEWESVVKGKTFLDDCGHCTIFCSDGLLRA